MPLLTAEALDLHNAGAYADWSAISRGRLYYAERRATVLEFDGETALCEVRGQTGNYTVTVKAEGKRRIGFQCDCLQAQKVTICKHMVASALAVRDYLNMIVDTQWQYRLQRALENTPKQKKTHHLEDRYFLLYGLIREKFSDVGDRYRLAPYRLKLKDWLTEGNELDDADFESLNLRLDSDRSWVPYAELATKPLDPQACVNAPIESVQVYNLIARDERDNYYQALGIEDFALYLSLLARYNALMFMMGARGAVKQRLRILKEPVTMSAALGQSSKGITIQTGLRIDEKVYSTVKDSLEVISYKPAWVLAGNTLVPVANPEALDFMRFFPLEIPMGDEQEFREKYFRQIAERMPILGDVVRWEDVHASPVPRLYLREEGNVLSASLRFGYGGYEVDADPKAETPTMLDVPNSWDIMRIHRQLGREEQIYQLLTDARYGIKRAGKSTSAGEYELRARTHPFDFLFYSVPLLTQAGFEIYGEEKLSAGKINRATPKISIRISSHLDWFDLETIIEYGDQQVSLRDIRKAMRKNERYVKLADGTIGQIPENWLERYRQLFELAGESDAGLRVADYHLPLVDTLLADAGRVDLPPEFIQRRERMRSFAGIQPQPIPTGFTGELRPYQKAGLDWLHFLETNGFGGCLADDMGLGKTIQVLAFLRSLREQGQRKATSLLVVPKSLLANWQREASRFTPDLRIREYFGNLRNKDTAFFNEVDILLTTYGTLLRDIESLMRYRFDYVILDESQAIKNPLSQSSKAARLLNADHRLVMTGTPVENNTFELWSQFAFLNPGLLGSLEVFKREFAAPIESKANEQAAHTLRQLVYPFILRRTKEQVAPELPPRTERIVYTDLEPAQHKLYTQTRERYRAELMGLIETQGIDNARMKILEGLLRMRQICIHPALVAPMFRGESAKFELLFETLDTLLAENHKALIFSQFVEVLKLVRVGLEARQIRYTYLDGQTQDRQAQVDLYQNDPAIPFFLISLKAGGVGLNLTAADYVIHLDPWWNPAVEMQAADRAHRIGQDKPVFVYKFIARDTVEEKILLLQERKKALVEQLITTEGSFFKSITQDDVKNLFS